MAKSKPQTHMPSVSSNSACSGPIYLIHSVTEQLAVMVILNINEKQNHTGALEV